MPRNHRAGLLAADEVKLMLHLLSELAVTRMLITEEMLQAAWTLRDSVAARDALYVVGDQALDARLLTTDERLARAVPILVADEGEPPRR